MAAYHNDRIKKESPNEGTETDIKDGTTQHILLIKKESPNEGTETRSFSSADSSRITAIKKESPNEGTETDCTKTINGATVYIKKESPNEGTETILSKLFKCHVSLYKKRIPE